MGGHAPEYVRNAIKRGVRITLYSNLYGKGSSSYEYAVKEATYLEKLGCNNLGDDNNHSKCVISESSGIIFTANIDGKHGMKYGFEIGSILNREQVTLAYEHIKKLINNRR